MDMAAPGTGAISARLLVGNLREAKRSANLGFGGFGQRQQPFPEIGYIAEPARRIVQSWREFRFVDVIRKEPEDYLLVLRSHRPQFLAEF
jgi:hypothetical protein